MEATIQYILKFQSEKMIILSRKVSFLLVFSIAFLIALGFAMVNTIPHVRTIEKKPDYLDVEPSDYYDETHDNDDDDYDLDPLNVTANAWAERNSREKYVVKLSFASSGVGGGGQNDEKKISLSIRPTVKSSTAPQSWKKITENDTLTPPWPIRLIWSSEVNVTTAAPPPKNTSTNSMSCKHKPIPFVFVCIYSIFSAIIIK